MKSIHLHHLIKQKQFKMIVDNSQLNIHNINIQNMESKLDHQSIKLTI
jgi:hypothetical protein